MWPWLATAASGLVVAAWLGSKAVGTLGERFTVRSSGADRPDAGTTGLGETVSSTSSTVTDPEPSLPVMANEPLPEPQPGQIRPNAKGRCPHQRHRRGRDQVTGVGDVGTSAELVRTQEIGPEDGFALLGDEHLVAWRGPVGERVVSRHVRGQGVGLARL